MTITHLCWANTVPLTLFFPTTLFGALCKNPHVRVTRGGCDTLMAQERLDIAQVGSSLVAGGSGRMTQRTSGNNRHPRTLAGKLEAYIEGLVAKGAAVPAGKPMDIRVEVGERSTKGTV
jgi:hypothetical protein